MKKTIAFFTALLISSSSFVYSFGQENKVNLSFEDALEIGIAQSINLDRYQKQLDKLRVQSRNLSFEVEGIDSNQGTSNIEFAILAGTATNINLAQNQFRELIDYEKKSIEIRIESIFNSINKLEQDLEFANRSLERLDERESLIQTKYRVGFESRRETENIRNEKAKILKEIEQMNLDLKSKSLDLNQILKKSPSTIYKVEPIEYNFKLIDESDINKNLLVARALEKDIRVSNLKNNIAIKQSDLELFTFTISPINFGQSTGEPYLISVIDKNIMTDDLRELKKEIENNIQGKLETLRKIESTIENLELNKAILQQELDLMEIRFDLGLITREPIKDMKLNKLELEKTIEDLKIQHSYIKKLYQEPFFSGTPNM